jgi:hypothetical protein
MGQVETKKAFRAATMGHLNNPAPRATSGAETVFSAFESGLVAPFLTLRDKNGWVRAKMARNLNLGVSRNRFCDFLADPDSRSFSRFGAIIVQFAAALAFLVS